MRVVTPINPRQVAETLHEANRARATLTITGNATKRLWGGPIRPTQTTLATTRLNRLLEYEKNDLTVSVEAGMRFSDLQATLAEHSQMIALDPPYASQATVGGILAANSSGPMGHRYGTARDLVIGMSFATLEGKLISSGGHVVKNVAGLDMGKVLIGSFGTLAVIVSVNLRVQPIPEVWKTFLFPCADLRSALARRENITRSTLRPVAMDLLNPAASERLGLQSYTLAVRAAASKKVMERYSTELREGEPLQGPDEAGLWENVREFSPAFLDRQTDGVALRVKASLRQSEELLRLISNPALYRCGAGTMHLYLDSWEQCGVILQHAAQQNLQVLVEAASDADRNRNEDALAPSSSQSPATFATIKTVKSLFDPSGLLNPSRLYGRI